MTVHTDTPAECTLWWCLVTLAAVGLMWSP